MFKNLRLTPKIAGSIALTLLITSTVGFFITRTRINSQAEDTFVDKLRKTDGMVHHLRIYFSANTDITQVNDIANTIASAVEEQTATTNEIARNISEAAQGGKQVAENVAAVAAPAKSTTEGAGNTQTAAAELSRMAQELQDLVGQFKIESAETAKGQERYVKAA